jgi:hypothetical protein
MVASVVRTRSRIGTQFQMEKDIYDVMKSSFYEEITTLCFHTENDINSTCLNVK